MGSKAPTRATLRGEAPPRFARLVGFACLLAASALTARAAPRERQQRDLQREFARPAAATSTPQAPTEWQPSRGPECIKRGPNRGFCAGPRRVPKPRGEAADLAKRLGLASRNACSLLLIRPPRDAWVDIAKRGGAAKKLLWPVEESRLLRGIGNLHAAEKRRKAQFGGHKKPGSSRRHPHEGLDIGAKEGAPIRAAQHGLVVYSDNALTGYGNLVIIVHADASVTFYGHCRATYVFAGQRVKQGQMIGEVGHTGYARGSHVHFEYRVGGLARDPTPLFAPH